MSLDSDISVLDDHGFPGNPASDPDNDLHDLVTMVMTEDADWSHIQLARTDLVTPGRLILPKVFSLLR